MKLKQSRLEGFTLLLIMGCYASWLLLTLGHASIPIVILIPALAIVLSFHNSLQHEVIHYHPTPWQTLNEALAYPPLALYLPFLRYRDSHRAHHNTATISYPAQDPESYYIAPEQWAQSSLLLRQLRRWNNTLLGRLLIGPPLAVSLFLREEWRALRRGDAGVRRAWWLHMPLVAAVIAWLVWCGFPWWAYALACHGGMALTAVRTFAEHQAVATPEERTIVVEARGFFSSLFLDNNLHSVHHKYPGLPWYQLRPTYQRERDEILRENGGYVFKHYGELFRRYAFKAKEPVVHPL